MTIHNSTKICSVQLLGFPSWCLGKKCVNRDQWVRTHKGHLTCKCSFYLWRTEISNLSNVAKCTQYTWSYKWEKRTYERRNSESSPDTTTEYWYALNIKLITHNNIHQRRKFQFNANFIPALQIYRSGETCLG
jgi:hypothetical protein